MSSVAVRVWMLLWLCTTAGALQVKLGVPSGLKLTYPERSEGGRVRCLLVQDVVLLRPELRSVHLVQEVVTAKLCADIIRAAEEYAETHGGWTTQRHIAFPTTDIPVDDIFGSFSSVRGTIDSLVLPLFAEAFAGAIDADRLKINELFVCKYEANEGRQRALSAHKDGTPFSFVMGLNDSDEFVGGGTYFEDIPSSMARGRSESDDASEALGVLMRPPGGSLGSCVLFSGKNRHRGEAVRSGVRYILTGFLDYPVLPKEGFVPEFDGSACLKLAIADELVAVRVGGDMVSVRGLGGDDLKAVLRQAGTGVGSGSVEVELTIGELDDGGADEADIREDVRRKMWHTLATGNYISLDDCVLGNM